MFKVKLNSLTSKSTYNQKNRESMKTALYILSKILSFIWAVVSVPLEIIITVALAITIYIVAYAVIIGAMIWILTL